jgi:predicted flavoprotein YhiN
MLTLSGLDGQLKANQVTREMRGELAYQLKNMSSRITRTRPIEEAVVTAGGVKTSEIDPRTMGSKLCKGLYFAGEVIDVDAYTGGFNLQIAFSTAAQAAAAIPLPQKEIKTEENEK